MSEAAASSTTLDVRALAAAGVRGVDWIEGRRDLDPLTAAALANDFEAAIETAGTLARAADRSASIGILARPGSFSDRLIATLTSPRDETPLGRFEGSHTRLPLVSGLLPAGDPFGLATVIRLTRRAAVAPAGRNTEAPLHVVDSVSGSPRVTADSVIRVTLLSLADVIHLLASAALGDLRGLAGLPVATIDEAARRASEEATGAVAPGLTTHEIEELRHALELEFPTHPHLLSLAAGGFWRAFASIGPRATATGRRRFAALLWGQLADFDALYGDLAGALEGVGFATEVTVPSEAVRDPGSAPGWGQAHAASILAAQTILTAGAQTAGFVPVRTRFGPELVMTRRVLALLMAEVVLAIEGHTQTMVGAADLVLLPTSTPTVPFRHLTEAPTSPDAMTRWLPAAVVQAKSRGSFARLVRKHDLDALVVHLDPGSPLPHASGPLISDWVAATHGRTPVEREAAESALFVAVGETGTASRSGWSALADFIGHLGDGDDWVRRWGIDQPFDGVFILGHGSANTHASKRPALPMRLDPIAAAPALQKDVTAGDTLWQRHVRDTAVALDEALQTSDGGVRFLAQSMSRVMQPRRRRQRLAAAVVVARSDLRLTVQRCLESGQPDADLDWRQQAATAASTRLRSVLQTRRLGTLLDVFALRAEEAEAVYDRVHADQLRRVQRTAGATRLGERLAQAGENHTGSDDPHRATLLGDETRNFGAAAIGTWIAKVRRLARTPSMSGTLGLPAPTLHQLADELMIAAGRLDLAARLTSRLEFAERRMTSRGGVAQGLAALLACETVSGFLEQLGFDAPGSPDHPLRRGTLGAPLFDRASASRADSMAGLDAARIAAQFGADWAEAYPALVDANLASARGMRFEDATYREIEGLLALLSSRARDSVP